VIAPARCVSQLQKQIFRHNESDNISRNSLHWYSLFNLLRNKQVCLTNWANDDQLRGRVAVVAKTAQIDKHKHDRFEPGRGQIQHTILGTGSLIGEWVKSAAIGLAVPPTRFGPSLRFEDIMFRRYSLLAAVVLTAQTVSFAEDPVAKPGSPSPAPAGFTALFNGKDFTNFKGWSIHEKGGSPADLAKLTAEEREKKFEAWTNDLKYHWKVDNGELVNTGTGPFLATAKDYGDYELLIEYKLNPTVDAGIYPKTMPQIQVWDPEDAKQNANGNQKGSGGLWNNPKDTPGRDPLVKADKPAGEWNQFRILVVGERITIHLNEKLVVDHARILNYYDKKAPVPKAAAVLLQTHPPKLEIRWRNIFVRELAAKEANEILAKKANDGFKAIFNGKDLDGWQGATENYEVVDGAVRCKKGKGGVLYTKDEFADFQVALEFKVPKNGNNGLAIRYPGGEGDGAYTGMCELQVLDDEYEGIDPRQAHGSAYGMAAAARGYQRPVGEWNYQLTTVKGSTIEVELNGTRILETDLSKISDFMAKTPHPGKDRTTGFFGFCGHNDPVEFRNVKLKPIK
jgi:hypothetical protein